MRLSGQDLNSSRLSRILPALLFPAPDRPSSTRRSSAEDEVEEGNEEEEEVKLGEEGEEGDKTGN